MKKNGSKHIKVSLGDRLRAQRDTVHLRQEQVATDAGIKPSTYSRIERDEILPAEDTLERIITALKFDSIVSGDVRKAFDKAKGRRVQVRPHVDFAMTFKSILKDYPYITAGVLSHSKVRKGTSAIYQWRNGENIPGGKTFKVLMEELEERGVLTERINQLRIAHVYNTFLSDKRLDDYLTEEEKLSMLEHQFGKPATEEDEGEE